MKISRKRIMAARKAVKAASGYYEITNYVDGIPQEIRILDSGVKFRVVRKNDGFKVLALKQGGHFDYSVETFNTPEEAADAMIQDTCTFRNRSLWDVKSATKTRKTPIKADAADVYENSDDTFEEIFYDICINDNHNGNYYEREEDAIEIANQYAADPAYADDEITVVLEHYMTNARGEIIDYFDDNGAVVWSSNDAIYDSTKITCASDANGYEDLALAFGDAIKKLAADEDHLNNFLSYLTQHFPEWLRKYANTPEGLVSEFREFANMNF